MDLKLQTFGKNPSQGSAHSYSSAKTLQALITDLSIYNVSFSDEKDTKNDYNAY